MCLSEISDFVDQISGVTGNVSMYLRETCTIQTYTIIFIADLVDTHALLLPNQLLSQCFQTSRLSIGAVGFADPVHALFPR